MAEPVRCRRPCQGLVPVQGSTAIRVRDGAPVAPERLGALKSDTKDGGPPRVGLRPMFSA